MLESKKNANPLLDTRENECTLNDGSVYRYNASIIAHNIYSQCDDEGRRHAVLQEGHDCSGHHERIHDNKTGTANPENDN